MSETCPTVKVTVDSEQGFIVINESDFDPNVHERFEAPAEAQADKPRNKPGPKPKAPQDAEQ